MLCITFWCELSRNWTRNLKWTKRGGCGLIIESSWNHQRPTTEFKVLGLVKISLFRITRIDPSQLLDIMNQPPTECDRAKNLTLEATWNSAGRIPKYVAISEVTGPRRLRLGPFPHQYSIWCTLNKIGSISPIFIRKSPRLQHWSNNEPGRPDHAPLLMKAFHYSSWST